MKAIVAAATAALTLHGCASQVAHRESDGFEVSPAIALNCADQVTLDIGSYRAENNTWGKGGLRGWSQCIGIAANARGTVAGRWTWNWPNSDDHVTAYPEIIFGQKPGKA